MTKHIKQHWSNNVYATGFTHYIYCRSVDLKVGGIAPLGAI